MGINEEHVKETAKMIEEALKSGLTDDLKVKMLKCTGELASIDAEIKGKEAKYLSRSAMVMYILAAIASICSFFFDGPMVVAVFTLTVGLYLDFNARIESVEVENLRTSGITLYYCAEMQKQMNKKEAKNGRRSKKSES